MNAQLENTEQTPTSLALNQLEYHLSAQREIIAALVTRLAPVLNETATAGAGAGYADADGESSVIKSIFHAWDAVDVHNKQLNDILNRLTI